MRQVKEGEFVLIANCAHGAEQKVTVSRGVYIIQWGCRADSPVKGTTFIEKFNCFGTGTNAQFNNLSNILGTRGDVYVAIDGEITFTMSVAGGGANQAGWVSLLRIGDL